MKEVTDRCISIFVGFFLLYFQRISSPRPLSLLCCLILIGYRIYNIDSAGVYACYLLVSQRHVKQEPNVDAF